MWERYDPYSRHPFETSTGMEGRCEHCGGPSGSLLHDRPWNPPLPEPQPDTTRPDPEARYTYLETATYDEPDRNDHSYTNLENLRESGWGYP